jgi:glycosyltransferase involved in cell wall biosynthesis
VKYPAGISIVLPAYNEAGNIERAVRSGLDVMQSLGLDHEVIVVDDGSSDATSEIGRGLVDQLHPRVRLIVHAPNRGYGAALNTGFSAAGYDLVFFTDSDNQFEIGELEYFLPHMSEFDVMTGFRVYRFDPVLRSILSWIYNRLVTVLFRVRVRDVDCAFKLFRHEVLDQISIETKNFFVSTELLARARKWNFRIGEKGVRHYPRTAGETSVRPSDIPNTLREVARMWQRIYFPTRRQLAARKSEATSTEYLPSVSRG